MKLGLKLILSTQFTCWDYEKEHYLVLMLMLSVQPTLDKVEEAFGFFYALELAVFWLKMRDVSELGG